MSVKDHNDADGAANNDQTSGYNGYNFGNQDEETALENYKIHDIGEKIAKQKLNELGVNFTDECGFDGREYVEESDEYDNLTEVPDDEVDDVADLQMTANKDVLIDIKTTNYPEYIGNMEKTAWQKHNRQVENGKAVIIVCFAFDDDNKVVKGGCYAMRTMESTGGNPAGGRYFVHCNQNDIKPLDELGSLIIDEIKKVSN